MMSKYFMQPFRMVIRVGAPRALRKCFSSTARVSLNSIFSLHSKAGLERINYENDLFDKYTHDMEHHIQDCQQMIYDDFVATSALERTSGVNETHHEVSGPYEYFFHRDKQSNHGNLFRRPIPSAGGEESDATLILDIDRLAKYYNRPVSLVHLKLSEDNNYVCFLLEVVNNISSSHHDSYRQTKLFLKHISLDVTCELDLPADIIPADLEITIGSPDGNGGSSPLQLFMSSSIDGIRPSTVHCLTLNPALLFGGETRNTTHSVYSRDSKRHVRVREKRKHKHSRKLSSYLSLRCSAVYPRDLTVLVQEPNPAIFLDLSKSKDEQFILVHHHSKASSKVSCMPLRGGGGGFTESVEVMKTLIPMLRGQQFFVNHAHDCFYVAASSLCAKMKASEELSIRRISGHDAQFVCANSSSWDRWEVVWPSQLGNESGCNERFILDDYDLFENHILVYARDKEANGDISVQLLAIEKKPTKDGVLQRVTLVKTWSGRDFQTIFEETYCRSGSSRGTVGFDEAEDYVWTVNPSANGNFTSKTALFSLSSTLVPEMSVSLNLETAELEEIKCRFSSLVSIPNLNQKPTRETLQAHLDEPSFLTRISKFFGQVAYVTPTAVETRRFVHCRRVAVKSSCDQYSVPLIIYSPIAEVKTPRPTILFGYGAYGVPVPTHYDSQVGIYLRRGWVVAFACTRGGGELGKLHHHSGKDIHKWNTFFDFKDCAEYLIAKEITSPALLCASGSSAGGLIMGVMVNKYSHLFKAFVMRNPFLDIATSVMDASSPLTIHEYDEWGYTPGNNQSVSHSTSKFEAEGSESAALEEQVLQVIKSYSPCSNVDKLSLRVGALAKDLPSVLITVGLQDDKVDPQESFKWMSLLRKKYSILGNDSATLLLNVRDNEGHEGGTTVEDQCHETAIEITFLEKEIGVKMDME